MHSKYLKIPVISHEIGEITMINTDIR